MSINDSKDLDLKYTINNQQNKNFKITPSEFCLLDFTRILPEDITTGISFFLNTMAEDFRLFNITSKIEINIFFLKDKITFELDTFYPHYRFNDSIYLTLDFNDIKKIDSQQKANIYLQELIDADDIHVMKPVSGKSVTAFFKKLDYLGELFEDDTLFEVIKKSTFNYTKTTGTGNVIKFENFSLTYFFEEEIRPTLNSHYFHIWFSEHKMEVTFKKDSRSFTIKNDDDIETTRQILLLMFKLSSSISCSKTKDIFSLDKIISL